MDPEPSKQTSLRNGQLVRIVKTHLNDESSNWEYSATVIPFDVDDWIAVEAAWSMPDADVEGVRFITGGKIIEFFSPSTRFNIFQVFDPGGAFTGIYSNITAPTRIELDEEGLPVLTWEDHWLDVVRLPDGTMKVLDEDEYQQSGVLETDPDLDQTIRLALDELVAQLASGKWDP